MRCWAGVLMLAAVLCPAALGAASPPQRTPLRASASPALAEASALLWQYDSLLGWASRLFDTDKRQALTAVYAWCRRADEIVDSASGTPAEKLEQLRQRREDLASLYRGEPHDQLDGLLLETVRIHPALGEQLFSAMLDGMETDAAGAVRYESWAELERYCYCVAGVVGEMSLPLLGVPPEQLTEAVSPAVSLGNAVQLVNILRDIGADAKLGRVYLPREVRGSMIG